MQNFFSFLWKFNYFFLFLFLEIISFSLMSSSQNYQGSVIINSTKQFTGSLHNTYSNIMEYFSMKKTNELLRKENSFLINKFLKYSLPSDTISSYTDSIYTYIGARVIYNSVHKRNNFLMLDKGSKHGIEADMGVICTEGIVGIVIGVSENYCSVMSVLHKNTRISAKIKKNRQLANVTWNKMNYLQGSLEDIPSHLQLYKGDTVISSGYSFIFPEGIMIGTIEKYKNRKDHSLNTADIKFSTDFNNLHQVFVIRNRNKEEIISLKQKVINE